GGVAPGAARSRRERCPPGSSREREPDASLDCRHDRCRDSGRDHGGDAVDAGAQPQPQRQLRRRPRSGPAADPPREPRALAGRLRERPLHAPRPSRRQPRVRGAGGSVTPGGRRLRLKRRPPQTRPVASSRNLSATATGIAMPLASADSLASLRGEWFGNAWSVSGRVLRLAIVPGTRWSTYEKSSLAMIGWLAAWTDSGPSSSRAVSSTKPAKPASFTVTG